MIVQQEGFASDSVRMIQTLRKEAAGVQILLFSATFSERVRNFALKIVGPEANQVFVPKEELSLDVIKQYCVVRLNLKCPSRSFRLFQHPSIQAPSISRCFCSAHASLHDSIACTCGGV